MARKFNIGRQSEYLMNSELFDAYSSIKYLNENSTPIQDKQAEISNGALWNDTSLNTNVLKRYNSVTRVWESLFKDYYHPASVTQQPVNPVDGQVWIDLNGVIRYYDKNSLTWKVAFANTAAEATNTRASLSNFQIMPSLSEMVGFANNYAVPDVSIGKLFDFFTTGSKLVDDSRYSSSSQNISFYYNPPADARRVGLSWVHVNPTFMSGCTKRLIKINKETSIVPTSINHTEFYGFVFGEPTGTFLRNITTDFNKTNIDINDIKEDLISDYTPVSGGIKLINTATKYDYIYAITYHFVDSFSTNMGNVLKNKSTVGTTNDVYVGVINDNPILFLDGVYQEQSSYSFSQSNGMIRFSGETITEYMDMLAVSFANILKDVNGRPLDLSVTNQDIVNDNIIYTHERLSSVSTFTRPIALVSGIAGHMSYTGITDQVSISGYTITINNFGPIDTNDSFSITIVDTGNSYVSSGITGDNSIVDININDKNKYLVFIEGICIGNSEMEITEGKILLHGDLENKEYYLIELNDQNEGTYLMFDAPVSYFTAQIKNSNPNVVYNDADMVTAYVQNSDNSINGVLVDQNFIKVPTDPFTNYVTGQVLNIKTENELGDPLYQYCIYNMDGTFTWKSFEQLYGINALHKLEDMVTQFSGKGSLSIMSNEKLVGSKLVYHSYTYADSLDEPLMYGNRNCVLNIKGHITQPTQDFYSSKTQTFFANKGCVSSYVNGIFTPYVDYLSAQCKFTIDTPLASKFVNWKNRDLYNVLKGINDNTTLNDLESLNLQEYHFTEILLAQMKRLSNSINQIENTNSLRYIIERTEESETYAASRIVAGPQDRYEIFDNTYTSSAYIGPGAINIYLNGVLLERRSYSIFDNCNIMLNDIQTIGGSDECDREDQSTWTIFKYYDKTTGEVKRINCQEADELTIELRPDVTLKKSTYNIKEVSYDTQAFDTIDYDFPKSLINTRDLIKIYINGILYDGPYTLNNGIITLEDAPLQLNPLEAYLQVHKDIKYEYKFSGDRITFEWR